MGRAGGLRSGARMFAVRDRGAADMNPDAQRPNQRLAVRRTGIR
jgi:hypothetical protein